MVCSARIGTESEGNKSNILEWQYCSLQEGSLKLELCSTLLQHTVMAGCTEYSCTAAAATVADSRIY